MRALALDRRCQKLRSVAARRVRAVAADRPVEGSRLVGGDRFGGGELRESDLGLAEGLSKKTRLVMLMVGV